MKRIKLLLFSVLVLLLQTTGIKAQGNTCPGTPFCTAVGTPFSYPNVYNGSTGQVGPSYGCMCSEPNPGWFYIKSTAAGTMVFTISQTSGDVDFCAWGPFTSASFANACNNLTGACTGGCSTTVNPACWGGIADCSYSINATENMTLVATAAGQYFIVMITNYVGTAGTITLTQNSGPGSDCSITCPPTTINLHAQTITNYNLGNAIYMPNGATAQCSAPFFVWPNEPPFTDPTTDILTPCLMADFNTFNTNETTNGSMVEYEGGSPLYDLCNGCPQGIIGGGIGTTGTELYEYLGQQDTTQAHPFVFCNTGTVGSTTVTIKNCWDGTVYAGPVVWNTTAASCFTLTIPASVTSGSAVYSIIPAGGGVGVYDYHDGYAYVDPSIMPAGTYTLTYTFHGRNGCPPGIGHYVFTVPTKPVVTITPTATTICAGSSTTLTGGGANTYTWNTGSSSNPLSVSPGSTTTYTVTGTNTGTGCKNTATATVTVNPLPVLSITPSPATLCSGSSSILTATGGTTYVWSANAGSATTSTVSVTPPTGTTVYTVTGTTSGCSSVKTVTLTVTATPTVNITGTLTICSGQSTTLTGATASTYSWSVGSSSNSISVNPSSTTTYTLTGTNGGLCSVTKTVTVNVTPSPTLTISGTTALCNGQSTTLTGATATGYTWSTGATTNTITVTPPTGTTTYTLNGSNGGACTSTKTVSVVVTATPTLTISGTTSLCGGQSTTLTGATATGYTWSTGATTNTVSVTPPVGSTTYTLTGANGACTASTTVTLNVTPSPTLAITGTTALCSGQSTTLTGATATGYTWSTGATTNTITVTPPTGTTTYTLNGSNGGACTSTKTVSVVVTATPTLSVSGAAAICSGQSTTLTGATATGYTWSTGATTNTISVTPPIGTTTYTLTGANGACTNSITANVIVTATPTLSISGTTAICSGQSTTLTGATATGYTWSPGGATTNTITVSPGTGTTSYTLTGANGTCTATSVASVNVTATPTVTITGNTNICSGSSTILTGALATSYNWSPGGATTNTITVSPGVGATTYTLTGNNNICSASAVVTVSVTATPTIAISGNADICSGQSEVLTGATATNYTWSPGGANTSSISVNPGSTTIYTLTGANGTCTTTAIASLSVTPTPTITITGAAPICNGQSLVLTGGTATSYTWTGGISTNTITVNPTTTSNYTLTGANGTCTTFAVATVTVNPLPVIGTASVTAAPCGLSTGCINSVSVSGGTPTYSYTWNGGTSWSVSSSTCNIPAGTYPLQVQDANGCISSANISVPSANGPVAPTAAASSATTCLGDSAVFTVNPTTANTTYTWTDITGTHTGATYTVTNITPPGTYNVSVTATDINGCLSTATNLTITVNSLPPTSVSGTSHFCKGTSTVLNASPSGAGYSYQWSQGGTPIGGATSANYTANTAGNYGVVITDNTTGCKAASVGNYTVTIDSLPKIDTTSMVVTNSNCSSSTGSVLSVTVNPSAGNAYSWTNSSGTVVGTSLNLSNVPAGNYCLLVTTNPTSCKDSICGVTITNAGAPPIPTLNTTGNTYCQGQTQGPIVVSGTGTFSWYSDPGLTTQIATGTTYTPNVVVTTTVYVTATNSGCQSISLPIVITINPTPAIPIVTISSYTYCQSQTVGSISASGTGTILWSANAGMNPVINTGNTYTPTGLPLGTTTYYLTDSLNTGCKSAGTATVSVLINPTPIDPTITAPSYTYCQGDPISPITANGTGTILWYDNAGLTPLLYSGTTYTPATTVGTTTYYLVDSSTSGGCKSVGTVTVSVTINATPTNPTVIAPSYTYCQGQSPTAITATGSGGGTILWSSSASMNPIVHVGSTYTPPSSATGTTVYYIQDSSNAGCKSTAAATTVTVTVYPTPTITGVPVIDSSKCGSNNGDVLGLNATGGTPNYTFQWIDQTGATVGNAANLTPIGPGTYSLIVIDANQCRDTSNTSFSVFGTSTINAAFTPSTVSGQAPLNVVFTNTSTGAANYGWTLGDNTTSTQPNPVYTYTTSGTYTVTLIATNGNCIDTATAVITVDIPTNIIIPNIFSPNGDSLNDVFIITCTGMKTLNCDIFNRWGQLVYTLTGPNQSWDGKLNNGNSATEGTYYFMLNAVGVDEKTYTYQGPITLVK